MSDEAPLVVNFFGGPGAGKSTLANFVYANLKSIGSPLNIEMAAEFAKDLVWENRQQAVTNQLYVLGNQFQRIQRLNERCDIIITDSPVLLSAVYAPEHYPQSFYETVFWASQQNPTLNIFVERHDGIYETEGRRHDYREAIMLDNQIKDMIDKYSTSPVRIAKADQAHAELMTKIILDQMAD